MKTSKRDSALKLESRQVGPATVVRVIGSAGMEEAERLRALIEDLVTRQVGIIVLDLADMDFICSLGLSAIISGHIKCRHYNGQIRLLKPQPAVLQLLETTRLTQLFPIFESLDQASKA